MHSEDHLGAPEAVSSHKVNLNLHFLLENITANLNPGKLGNATTPSALLILGCEELEQNLEDPNAEQLSLLTSLRGFWVTLSGQELDSLAVSYKRRGVSQ